MWNAPFKDCVVMVWNPYMDAIVTQDYFGVYFFCWICCSEIRVVVILWIHTYQEMSGISIYESYRGLYMIHESLKRILIIPFVEYVVQRFVYVSYRIMWLSWLCHTGFYVWYTYNSLNSPKRKSHTVLFYCLVQRFV